MHGQAEAVEFVERNADLHQHLDACLEGLPRAFLEIRTKQAEDVAPDDAARLGHEVVAPRVLLHELHVAMPRSGMHAHLAQLGLYPIFIGQTLLQASAHQGVEVV